MKRRQRYQLTNVIAQYDDEKAARRERNSKTRQISSGGEEIRWDLLRPYIGREKRNVSQALERENSHAFNRFRTGTPDPY